MYKDAFIILSEYTIIFLTGFMKIFDEKIIHNGYVNELQD